MRKLRAGGARDDPMSEQTMQRAAAAAVPDVDDDDDDDHHHCHYHHHHHHHRCLQRGSADDYTAPCRSCERSSKLGQVTVEKRRLTAYQHA